MTALRNSKQEREYEFLAPLEGLVGKAIQLIFLEKAAVYYDSSVVQAASLCIGDGESNYLRISPIWLESPVSMLDYYKFAIEVVQPPTKESRSSYFSFGDARPVKRITAFTSKISSTDETVEFASDIVIERCDQKTVCVTGGGSALRKLMIYKDVDVIRRILSGKEKKVEWTST